MGSRRVSALAALGLLLYACAVEAQIHTVAVTVDDLPFAAGTPAPEYAAEAKNAERVNETILHAFTRHHVPATGFVIEQRAEDLGLPASRKILEQWTRPGFDLGNHLYSHPDVNSLSVDQIEREITRGEATFAPLLGKIGRSPGFLRFPYNHTGDTREKHDAIAAFMSSHGYRLAPCTIDNSDYEFNATYAVALSLRDSAAAARAKADYIAYTGAEIDWYTALNRQVFGYDIPHIMLLHDNPLNAAAIEDVLALFEQRGYRFVTLAEAVKDPAYAVPETWMTKYGPMWGYRWAHEKNVKVNGRDEPEPPVWIGQYVKNHQAR
jgi:peptidoglycan/xylan/chitin deacetylase (PgdA/CDA1 family)